ncbi:MAG: response regulator [Candidatus Zixiibacteriota bacterium]|jgi:DNA-binding NtrC family response regulator
MPDKIKLLIVDDEVKFLDSIAQRLEMRGFDVTKAINGEEAVKWATARKFDLALLDLKMPGMDGKQVLEILKKEHKYLEVIILTGHGSLDSAVECTKLGAFSYLPKPYEIDKLLETLKEAYEARMRKKFELDGIRLQKIQQLATGNSALGILRALRELDNEEK